MMKMMMKMMNVKEVKIRKNNYLIPIAWFTGRRNKGYIKPSTNLETSSSSKFHTSAKPKKKNVARSQSDVSHQQHLKGHVEKRPSLSNVHRSPSPNDQRTSKPPPLPPPRRPATLGVPSRESGAQVHAGNVGVRKVSGSPSTPLIPEDEDDRPGMQMPRNFMSELNIKLQQPRK